MIPEQLSKPDDFHRIIGQQISLYAVGDYRELIAVGVFKGLSFKTPYLPDFRAAGAQRTWDDWSAHFKGFTILIRFSRTGYPMYYEAVPFDAGS